MTRLCVGAPGVDIRGTLYSTPRRNRTLGKRNARRFRTCCPEVDVMSVTWITDMWTKCMKKRVDKVDQGRNSFWQYLSVRLNFITNRRHRPRTHRRIFITPFEKTSSCTSYDLHPICPRCTLPVNRYRRWSRHIIVLQLMVPFYAAEAFEKQQTTKPFSRGDD